MEFEYKKEECTLMTVILENGLSIQGEFVDLRIKKESIPAGKEWYQLRHCDEDEAEPASLKRGCVAVNFLGTLICDPIEDMQIGDELEITEWDWC